MSIINPSKSVTQITIYHINNCKKKKKLYKMLPLTLLGKYKYFLMTRKKILAIINKKNLIKSKSTKSILK